MVVALGAAHGGSHPDLRNIADPVRGVHGIVFLRLDSAFVGGLEQAVVARGDELAGGRLGEQVSSELFAGELIEGKVIVERVDHPVAVGRDAVVLVPVVADGVGEANQVEPVRGHSLSVVFGCKKTINESLVSFRGRVGPESIHDPGLGRQPGEVKIHTPNEGDGIGIRRRLPASFLDVTQGKAVDPAGRPPGLFYGG